MNLLKRNLRQYLQAPYSFWGLIVQDFGMFEWEIQHYEHDSEKKQEWKDFHTMWFMGGEL